jgi:glutamate-ammonia-ligase adenylyltransferase
MLLLREEPRLARMLATLFGTSDRLADLLVRHPPMWDALVEGLGAPTRTRAELLARLAALMPDGARAQKADPAELEEARLGAIRRFQAEETLRIGLHDVSGGLEPEQVTTALTDLAEVCLEQAIAATWPGLVAKYGVPATGLTVLGLGSLGAREMRYGSDLDLVFLFGADGESTSGVDHREWFARASVRFISVETMLDDGRLYKIDTRLRPSGEQGLLVTSWNAFDRYHRDEAAGWERVALLRARIVYGTEDAALRGRREAQLQAIAFDSPFDQARFVADLRRVRARVETERGRVPAGSRHLRFDPGGIMDVEFLVALGQLLHAADNGVRTTTTSAALARLVALGWPESLPDDLAALRRATLRLRLLLDRPEDVVSPRDLPLLARSLGTAPDALGADLDARLARIRAIFDARFQ